ncbi:MAG: glycosyltransferase [Rubrivivax sp.]|nr:glycosyltransferase [Rubrivivax sp.]
MNILVIAPHYPFADRASGDLRFSRILQALTREHRLFFCPIYDRLHAEKIGHAESLRYKRALEEMGVAVCASGPREVLKKVDVDAVWFEFYFAASPWLRGVRVLRPRARVIVDSVDVHWRRLEAKAALTGQTADAEEARRAKQLEISTYRAADTVVAVTDDDARLLAQEVEGISVKVIPNIHAIHEPVTNVSKPVLSFVGGFSHDPNTDAVIYFCNEVLPLIRSEIPDVVFNVIGNAPPAEVRALASDTVRILGYVPDTTPLLQSTMISVAPLRYGAGMKGKVGEAMSLGLPVVTTSVGAEGFGLTPGSNVLIGDTPQAFAAHVVRLIGDAQLRRSVGLGGHALMRQKYSEDVVMRQVLDLFRQLPNEAVQTIPLHERLVRRAGMALDEHVLWRIKRHA